MDKRYQVFVSSTYEDLEEERQEVMHALLELDCIPSGMELFPATSDDQWTLIRKVINDCDYYVVIIGGRYGSIGPTGIGYTEMEYQYAVEQEKPVIAFLHRNPEELTAKRTEQTEEGRKKLDCFRKVAQQRMCKFWASPSELGGVVSRSLIRLTKSNPAVGWVRADSVSSQDAMAEILNLRRKVDELQSALENLRAEPPSGAEDLAQGNDSFAVYVEFPARELGAISSETFTAAINITWNRIFWALGPLMISEARQVELLGLFRQLVARDAESQLRKRKRFRRLEFGEFFTQGSAFSTVLVQLRALGLIRQSEKSRPISDTATYWTLTPYGDSVMTRLRALRRTK